jgi:hypothetical protein
MIASKLCHSFPSAREKFTLGNISEWHEKTFEIFKKNLRENFGKKKR